MGQIYEGDHTVISPRNLNVIKDFRILEVRPEIMEFAIEMEKEMQRKDKLGYDKKSRNIEDLRKKLKEERNEVDDCFSQSSTFNNKISNVWINKLVEEEFLHEGIMLVILRHELKNNMNKDNLKNKYK